MKKLALLILFVISSPVFSFAEELVIATFNCEFLIREKVHFKFGDGSDGQWSQPAFREVKFKEAAKAVAGVIDQVGADVITLTEVGDEADVETLRSEIAALGLSYPYIAVGDSTDYSTRQHVAVLSKFPLADILPRIPGRESYLAEHDDPEEELETGVSKGMRVSFTAHGKEFLLYVLHLRSEAGGYQEDQQRLAQASIVRRHYLPHPRAGKLIIVAGDMNDRRGDPTIHRLRGLDDIDEDLIQTGHLKYFTPETEDTRWTYAYNGIRNQIDHILLSNSIKDICKSNGIQTSVLEQNNPLASDHRPLVVKLDLR